MTDWATEIQARLDAATPGPWYAETGARAPFVSSHAGPVADMEVTGRKTATEEADAALIAHAPDDLAFLLGRVRELEEALHGTERALTVWEQAIGVINVFPTSVRQALAGARAALASGEA